MRWIKLEPIADYMHGGVGLVVSSELNPARNAYANALEIALQSPEGDDA